MLRLSKLFIVLSLSFVLLSSTTANQFSTNISIRSIFTQDNEVVVNQVLDEESKIISEHFENGHLDLDLLQNDSKIIIEDVLNETLIDMNVIPRDFVLDSTDNIIIFGEIENYDPGFANTSFGARGMNDTIIMKFNSDLD